MPKQIEPVIVVTFEPHYVNKTIARQRMRIPAGQSSVLVNGVEVAYICDKPGSPLNFLERFPDAFKEVVTKEVERQRDSKVGRTSEPPPAFVPTETPDTEE